VCAVVCEALYKGAIQSSCDLYLTTGIKCGMYQDTFFAKGMPQWGLRGVKPMSDWSSTVKHMKIGMANSMLTSQAPTATTSMLVGVTESVTLPIHSFVAKESENGRDTFITYGLMYRCAFSKHLLPVKNDIDSQVAMYEKSLPYVDHSQSAMFNIALDEQQIFDLIVKTFKAKMKTGIYYLVFKQENPTLDGTKNEDKIVSCKLIRNNDADDCSACYM
jgi:hypothetical protein